MIAIVSAMSSGLPCHVIVLLPDTFYRNNLNRLALIVANAQDNHIAVIGDQYITFNKNLISYGIIPAQIRSWSLSSLV